MLRKVNPALGLFMERCQYIDSSSKLNGVVPLVGGMENIPYSVGNVKAAIYAAASATSPASAAPQPCRKSTARCA